MQSIDINSNYSELSVDIQSILVKDMTTNKNIIDNEYNEISQDINLTPRAQRSKDVNKKRSADKAEIFTPIHIVDKMNSMVEEEYAKENHSFDEYIDSTRLEITCGEGVFLATRYDSETGLIIPVRERKGLLDRKLEALNKHTNLPIDWMAYAIRVCKSIYGYEYQADSLLIARINILYSFIEYYDDKFNKTLPTYFIKNLSEIIVWNLFQMDGLTMCIPQESIKVDKKTKNHIAIDGIPVKIMNWKENKIELFMDCGDQDAV